MIIPRAFTVGKKRYVIEWVRALFSPPCYGRTFFSTRRIKLAAANGHGKRYTTKERDIAFWHETVHTCLEDMGVPVQEHDEKFVQALAVRLAQVCDTAEF